VAIAPLELERSTAVAREERLSVLGQAVWFALLTGLLEFGARAIKLYLLHQVIMAAENPHNAWMTLVANVVLFGVAGLLLSAVKRLSPELVPVQLATFVFACLTFFSLGDVLAVKQWYAALILALGVGAVAARLVAGNPGGFTRLVRRTRWIMAGVAIAVSLGILGAAWARESRALAALPPAPPKALNVLFITLDTVRAADTSLHGYVHETTPRLRRLAANGVCFERAISTVSWTLPSHASMFTGRYPYEMFRRFDKMNNDDWELPFGSEFPTLAEYLGQHGYRTGGFVANWMYCDRVYGLDRGCSHYEDYSISIPQVLKAAFLTRSFSSGFIDVIDRSIVLARKDAARINGEFLDWLDRDQERPFFAFLNYMDAHEPYAMQPGFTEQFSQKSTPGKGEPPAWIVPPDVAARRLQYDRCIAYLDSQLGKLFDELEQRGRMKDTIVVVTSDHGEHFGEHGMISHGDTVYMPVLHVPLVIVGPSLRVKGQRVRETISLRDLAATIVELLHWGEPGPFPGRSLSRYWKGGAASEPAFSNLDCNIHRDSGTIVTHLRSLVDNHYQYIVDPERHREELYDLHKDPHETSDLGGLPEAAGVKEQLRRYLEEHFPESEISPHS
jgi:arylsulfatase A-like enzyme